MTEKKLKMALLPNGSSWPDDTPRAAVTLAKVTNQPSPLDHWCLLDGVESELAAVYRLVAAVMEQDQAQAHLVLDEISHRPDALQVVLAMASLLSRACHSLAEAEVCPGRDGPGWLSALAVEVMRSGDDTRDGLK
jgi:hypothetical protein